MHTPTKVSSAAVLLSLSVLMTLPGCAIDPISEDPSDYQEENVGSHSMALGGTMLSDSMAAPINLAFGRPTSQSSTAYGGDPSRAVDGDSDGDWFHGSMTHTVIGQPGWWQVDLEAAQPIGEIVIHNRTDCCSALLHDFSVEVSSDGSSWESFLRPGVAATETRVQIDRVARYVRISNPEVLHLAEVEVLRTRNLAYGKLASQSSTAFGGLAGRAVDGNSDGNWFHGSLSHTASGTGEWWQVDLAAIENVGAIVIHERTDCCQEQLNNATLRISNDGANWYDIPFNNSGAASQIVIPVNRDARYVRVENGTGYLHLAEVQVFEGLRLPAASYGRGVGWVPSYACLPGEGYDLGTCWQPCPTGFHPFLDMCWNDVIGATPLYQFRSMRVSGDWVASLPVADCGIGNEYDAGLCYPLCELGYDGVGPVCWHVETTLAAIEPVCGLLRLGPMSSIAEATGQAHTLGLGLSIAAGATASSEIGVAYGPNGEFGCYLTGCYGFTTGIGFSAYATSAIYGDFTSIAGPSSFGSIETPLVDFPLFSLNGSASQIVSGEQTIGYGVSASLGAGESPPLWSLSAMNCDTTMVTVQ